MAEQYNVAAERHQRVAEQLEDIGAIDDAAYHYGLVGENAIKHALRASGMEAVWNEAGIKKINTPMGKHFPRLNEEIENFSHDVHRHAVGRLGGRIRSVIGEPGFEDRFLGWKIDIRYADDACVPVDVEDCRRWRDDANYLFLKLVLMI